MQRQFKHHGRRTFSKFFFYAALVACLSGCLSSTAPQDTESINQEPELVSELTIDPKEFAALGGAVAVILTSAEPTTINATLRHLDPTGEKISTCRLLTVDDNSIGSWGSFFEQSTGAAVLNREYIQDELKPERLETYLTLHEVPLTPQTSSILVAGAFGAGGIALESNYDIDLTINASQPITMTIIPAKAIGCVEEIWDLQPDEFVTYSGTTVASAGAATAEAQGAAFGWASMRGDGIMDATFSEPAGPSIAFTGIGQNSGYCQITAGAPGQYDLALEQAIGQNVALNWLLIDVPGWLGPTRESTCS
jgi:hypothetical protein